MTKPSPLEQLLYLGQVTSARYEHRDWATQFLTHDSARWQGLMLALPNALLLTVLGVAFFVLLGDSLGLLILAAVPILLIVGSLIPAISERRLRGFAEKHAVRRSAG